VTTSTLGGVDRAATWRLLALGFAAPTEETLCDVEALASGLHEVDSSPETADLLAALAGSAVHDIAAQYHALFGGTVRVSPYEGGYELDPVRQGREMADVAAFYRAFGAEPDGPAGERPDHVGCELEFLSYLELRRIEALEANENAELLHEIGDTFLRDHLGRWLPTFFAAVREASAGAPFYRALARLGARAIEKELERRSLEPRRLPRRPGRLSVESDSLECDAISSRSPS
jgi:TorA maturation chaperone TorD